MKSEDKSIFDEYEEEIPNFKLMVSLLMKHKKIKCFDDVKIKYYKILLILFIFFLPSMLIDFLKLNFSVSILGLGLNSSSAWFSFITTISEIMFFSFLCITGLIQNKSEQFKLSFISRYIENKNFSLSEFEYINHFMMDNYYVELIKSDYSIRTVIYQVDNIISKYKINNINKIIT